jgi:hypothetical protein
LCVGYLIYLKKREKKNKGHSSSSSSSGGGGGSTITLLLCFAAAVVFGAFRIFLVLSLLPGRRRRRRRRFFQGSVQLLERGVHLIFSLGPVPLLVHPPHSLKDRKIKNNTRCLGFSNKKNSVLIF